MKTLEQKALESFDNWYKEALSRYFNLQQVPKHILLSCFYSGAAFGSRESDKIVKEALE